MTPPARLLLLHRNDLTHLLILGGTSEARLDVARAFHSSSPARFGRLVTLDARTDEARLARALESWLAAPRPVCPQGPIGASEGGTLFVDSLESLGANTQRMLLAFAKQTCDAEGEEHWVGRLAAGNDRPLDEAVDRGRFSLELLDALDKVRVEVRWSQRPPGLAGRASALAPRTSGHAATRVGETTHFDR